MTAGKAGPHGPLPLEVLDDLPDDFCHRLGFGTLGCRDAVTRRDQLPRAGLDYSAFDAASSDINSQ